LIKKILDKKDNLIKNIFEQWISKGQGKLLTKNNSRYINKTQNQGFFKELTLVRLQNLWLKNNFLSQYLLSFYRNIVSQSASLKVGSTVRPCKTGKFLFRPFQNNY